MFLNIVGWYKTVIVWDFPCNNALFRLVIQCPLQHCMDSFSDGNTTGTQVSHEKNPGWLGRIRDYTTQLYRDYHKPL